jgi:hypothetical protein
MFFIKSLFPWIKVTASQCNKCSQIRIRKYYPVQNIYYSLKYYPVFTYTTRIYTSIYAQYSIYTLDQTPLDVE